MCLLYAAGVKRQIYKTIPTLEVTGCYNEKDLCILLKSKVEKIRFQQWGMSWKEVVEAERK